MQKAYNRINWENYPSDKTPLNEANLNKLDAATDELDNRAILLDNTKLDKTDASGLIKNFELDKATGIITITYFNGAKVTIDTMLEKLAVNFDYDRTTQSLLITLDDGTVKAIDLSALITQYEFKATDMVAFSVDADGKVSAIIKEGSIHEKHLRPDYLADIRVESAKAEASAQIAQQAEINAEESADNATRFVNEAMRRLDAGELKGDRGNVIYTGNQVRMIAGNSPVGIRSDFVDNVQVNDYYMNVNTGDYFICTNVTEDKSYWDYIMNLKGAEGKRGSRIYAIESIGVFPPQEIAGKAYTGDFFLDAETGDFYEVTESGLESGGVFDAKFVANIKGPAGDVAASAVTGVKGNTETNYRTGNVNITPANIGAVNKTGDTMSGDLTFGHGKGVYWRESGYGDKFKIVPEFSGADDNNKLLIQSAVGAANTDPEMTTKISIAGKTGNTEFAGNLTTKGMLRSECIELNQNGTLTNFGGFIDFHYGGDTADYTSRIIEDAKGVFNVNGVKINNSDKSVNASKYLINNTDINSIFLKASTITTATDLNTIKTTGVYHIKINGCANIPANSWGTLFVSYEGTPYQIYIPDNNNYIHRRIGNATNGTWQAWRNISATTANYLNGSQFSALKEFVEATATDHQVNHAFRFKDTTGWTPRADWYRCWVQYQNACNQSQYDIGGNVILIDTHGVMYCGNIIGHQTKDYTVTWNKLATSSDIDTLKTSFQAGCSKIATAITNNGVSTAANASPDTMATNIGTLATNKYNAGSLAARNSVATALTNVGVSTASGASATDITNNISTLATGYGRFYNIMKFMTEKGHGTDLITNEAGDDIIVVKKGTTVTANFKLGTAMNKYVGTQNSDGTQFRPPIGQVIKQGSYDQQHTEYTGLNSNRNGQFINVWTSRNLASPMNLAITGVKCGMEIFSLVLKRTDTSEWVTKWVYVLVI